MALPNLVVSAVAEWNGKALNKGASQIGKFDKTVKNLGRTLGVTFSAAALLGYSKKAVAAYGEQIAEAKRLDTALRNLGYSFATAEAEGYIDTVERVTGINRDQLQPAFIELAQITRSTTIAQSMLNTALDISAGTGMDLTGATKILSQAYVGNYKGLQQLNLGLTKAELSSKSYLEIEKLIATQYAGQSKNAADSYQGSLNKLKIAAEQASEQIGQGLVSALSVSSGGFDKLIDKVDNFGDSINGLIVNVAYLSKDLKDLFASIPGAGILDNVTNAIKNKLGDLSIGRARELVDILKGRQGGFPQGVPQDIKNMQLNIEKVKMDKLALARQKELIALQKKAQLAEKNKLSLSKAAAVFDTTRISIAAALKATYDKETRLRLEALMAIEDDNGDLALKKIGELAAFQKNADLEKLAGVNTISSATLESINKQLLTELAAINSSKMAEADKEIARNAAFGKYNAAIIAAGTLADKASYNERVQIQLTEIARLASLSDTTNAAITLGTLREQAELNMIDRVAKAQKAADDARLKALQDYANLLGKINGSTSGLSSGTAGNKISGGTQVEAKGGTEVGVKGGTLLIDGKTLAELAAESADQAIIDADIIGEIIDGITGDTSLEAILEYADAASARADAISTLLDAQSAANMALLTANALKDSEYGLESFRNAEADALLSNQNGGSSGAFDKNYYITVNAGVVGSEQTIVDAIQAAIQAINRAGNSIETAGSL